MRMLLKRMLPGAGSTCRNLRLWESASARAYVCMVQDVALQRFAGVGSRNF